MLFIEQSLSRNEKIESVFKLHWLAWLQPVIILLTAGVISLLSYGLLAALFMTWVSYAILAVGFFGFLYEWLQLKFLEQAATNKRVVLKQGIIARRTQEMKLKAIETIEIDQSIFGRIFGFGNVKITGRGISDLIFKSIDNPVEVKRSIESIAPISD